MEPKISLLLLQIQPARAAALQAAAVNGCAAARDTSQEPGSFLIV
jgi:hypothetical protein